MKSLSMSCHSLPTVRHIYRLYQNIEQHTRAMDSPRQSIFLAMARVILRMGKQGMGIRSTLYLVGCLHDRGLLGLGSNERNRVILHA